MKKPLVILLMLVAVYAAKAQNALLPNGGFEKWTTTTYEGPLPWFTSNLSSVPNYGIVTVSKVTVPASSLAVRMETKVSGQDVLAAYISNTYGDPEDGEGGVPFTYQAISFHGKYKYSIVSGDTAFIIVIFKKNGNIISNNLYSITGSQSSYTGFSFPVKTMAQAPDSVIIAAVSGNVINGTPKAGSWLELDDLAFEDGVVFVMAPNGDFEVWNTNSYDDPDDWRIESFGKVEKTTDKHSGNYAAKLISEDDGSGYVELASLLVGKPAQLPGVPFNLMADTLTGYYKYSATGGDNGVVYIEVTDPNGISLAPAIYHQFAPASGYTYFEIPISSTVTPSNLAIEFMSSDYMSNPVDGSTLYIDNLRLKHMPNSIHSIEQSKSAFTVYPNPAKNTLYIKQRTNSTEPIEVHIYDMMGKVVYSNNHASTGQISIPLQDYASGIYHYAISNGALTTWGKFVKE